MACFEILSHHFPGTTVKNHKTFITIVGIRSTFELDVSSNKTLWKVTDRLYRLLHEIYQGGVLHWAVKWICQKCVCLVGDYFNIFLCWQHWESRVSQESEMEVSQRILKSSRHARNGKSEREGSRSRAFASRAQAARSILGEPWSREEVSEWAAGSKEAGVPAFARYWYTSTRKNTNNPLLSLQIAFSPSLEGGTTRS